MTVEVRILDAFRFHFAFPPSPTTGPILAYRAGLLEGADVRHCDVIYPERTRAEVQAFQPDCIVHLAALPLVELAQRAPEEARASLLGTLESTLAAAADTPSVRRFVFASSSMVYGDFTQASAREDACLRPKNLYGSLKLAGEALAREAAAKAGFEAVIVRPSGVYGPGDINGRVVQAFCEKALLGQRAQVNDPETNIIDFTWIGDLAQGMVLAATRREAAGAVLNLGSGVGRSLGDLVAAIRHGVPDFSPAVQIGSDAIHPRRGALDIAEAARLLGYAPQVRLEEGVRQYLAFLRTLEALERRPAVTSAALDAASA